MRLNKRIAIGVLATVMVLSMLTACSDSGGGAATAPDGGSGTSIGDNANTEPDDKKDDSVTPPKEDTDVVQAQNRTEKFFSGKYAINGKRWTYRVDSLYMNGEQQWTGTTIIASDGYRTYERMENFAGVVDENDIYDPAKGVYYRVYPDMNQVVQYSIEGSRSGLLIYDYLYNTPKRSPSSNYKTGLHKIDDIVYYCESWTSNYEVQYSIEDSKSGLLIYEYLYNTPKQTPSSNYKAGLYKIDDIVYYCESWTSNYNGSETTTVFCFDKDDVEGKNLRYCVSQTKTGDKVTNCVLGKVSNIGTEFDAALLQIPEGYDFYIYDKNTGKEVSTGTKTGKDNYPN